MSKASQITSTSKHCDGGPPQLSANIPSISDIEVIVKQPQLPVDILLLTVEDYEFLACYQELKDPYRWWFDDVGYVYFAADERQEEKVKVALMRCCRGGTAPGGSLIMVKNAVTALRPKAVISVGTCSGLNPEKTKLGDVVVSSKVVTSYQEQSTGMRSYASRRFLNVIKNCADGWQAPLMNPEARKVEIHRGEFLSGPELVSAEWRRKQLAELHPQATALEMEGEGLFTAAFDVQVEWLMVKGISDYADGSESMTENWRSFASVTAASVVANILSDPLVFKQWPHYQDAPSVVQDPAPSKEIPVPSCSSTPTPQQSHSTHADHADSSDTKQSRRSKKKGFFKQSTTDSSEQSSASKSKGKSTFPSTHDSKRIRNEGPKQGGVRTGARGGAASGVAGALRGSKQARYDKVAALTRFDLKRCQDQLHTFYNKISQVRISPWDPDDTVHIDDVYTNLSWLRDHKTPRGTRREKLGDYSEIFYGNVRSPNPKRILIYGRPGIGKSTFSQKIAFDWTSGRKEILKRFKVLLMIKLRDVCGLQDFGAVLKAANLLAADDTISVDSLYNYIRQNQDQVLLVLDGYDEYTAGDSSPVDQIWERNLLRDCHVIMTMRPTEADKVRKSSDFQLQIRGFDSKEQVQEFASKYLTDSQEVEELLRYLSTEKIWDIAEIPLLLLMMCLVWRDRHHRGLPKSRLGLYERFVATLIYQMAVKDSDKKIESNVLESYKEELSKIGRLALDALLQGTLYFPLKRLNTQSNALNETMIRAGLFQISKLSSADPNESVFFLHKSIQEFAAAWFIMHEAGLKEGNTACLSSIDSLDKVLKIKEILTFMCQWSEEGAKAVFSLLRLVGEKEGLTKFNFTEAPTIEDMSKDQRRFCTFCLDCFLSCSALRRQAVYPLFLNCSHGFVVVSSRQRFQVASEHVLKSSNLSKPDIVLFETTYDDVNDDPFSIMRDLETVIVTYNDADDDMFSIMRDLETVIVTCFGHTMSAEKYENLSDEDFFLKKEGQQMVLYVTRICQRNFFYLPPPPPLNDDSLDMKDVKLPVELLRVLTSAPESPPQKSVGHVSQNQDDSSSLYLTEKTSDQTLKHSLSFVRKIKILQPTSEHLTVVCNVLAFVNRLRVMNFKPLAFKFNDARVMNFFRLILSSCFTNNLYELTLRGLNLSATCAADIARSLHQAPNLHKLDLSHNTLCSGVRDLAENLYRVPHLTVLRLNVGHMGDQECRVLATSLKHVAELHVLDLSDNPLGHGIIELAEHLHSVPHLAELNLSGTRMGKEEITAVALGLQSVPRLKKLTLSFSRLGHGIIKFAEHPHSVPHLTELDLSDTQIGEEEVTPLACALKYVPELEQLHRSDDPLGQGVSELIQHLSSVPQLRHLNLNGVQMTKKEASELCSAVRGTEINLRTDYHIRDNYGGDYRLRTDAELKKHLMLLHFLTSFQGACLSQMSLNNHCQAHK